MQQLTQHNPPMTKPERPVDMITMSGAEIWYDQPEYTLVSWDDIRLQTSNICRYNGCLDWKLLEHLALCAYLAAVYADDADSAALASGYGASHDFHEIYCTDIVSGMKKHLPAYQAVESNWEQYVHDQIGLPWSDRPHKAVKYADGRALVVEMDGLGHPAMEHCSKIFGGLPTKREKAIFQLVHRASIDECWEVVMKSITSAKEVLNKQ